jgi:hypothetical protein
MTTHSGLMLKLCDELSGRCGKAKNGNYEYAGLTNSVVAIVMEIVKAEREACAKIAETAIQMSEIAIDAPMGSEEQKVLISAAMAETAKIIANSIRERK